MRTTNPFLRLRIIVLPVLFVGGCHRAQPGGGDAKPASVERVQAAKPQRKTLARTTTQPARIEAFEETPLFAKVAGYVKKVHKDIGDSVGAGQPLVTLDVPELADDVAQKEAMLAQAEAELKQAAANVQAVKAAADTAKAKVEEARAGTVRTASDYERVQAENERIKSLAQRGSVTGKLVDESLNQLQAAAAAREKAEAAVRSAEKSAEQAEANVGKAEADQQAADARIGVAKAELARARTMLGYAEIKSPYAGVVTQRTVDTGHFVQPGRAESGPVMAVARTDEVRVFLDVPEMDAGLVDVGDEATLDVQAIGGKKLLASVTRTSWSLAPANRSLQVEIDFKNEGAKLRPGMFATGTITLAKRDNVFVLPTSAIIHNGAETFCACVESGKITRRKIELGLQTASEVEVASGLNDNLLVVTSAASAPQPGQAVQVIERKK
jgi:RND family efflux transporter MFP subunit